MTPIEPKLLQLKDKLESTAFIISKGGNEKQAHSEIVQSLVIVSEVLQLIEGINHQDKSIDKSLSDITDAGEVNKVARRLKSWAKHQDNINAKILNAFLELERSGVSIITEEALKNKLPELNTFKTNFNQMNRQFGKSTK